MTCELKDFISVELSEEPKLECDQEASESFLGHWLCPEHLFACRAFVATAPELCAC